MDINVVSWDGHDINDGTNYVTVMPNYPLFPAQTLQSIERGNVLPLLAAPAPGSPKFTLFIAIENAGNGKALAAQLAYWFDPRDGQSKQLVIADDDGSNERYLMARCLSLTPMARRGRLHWQADMIVDGLGDPDGRFRTATQTSDTWYVTASGDTNIIDNEGEDDAYPIFTIQPTSIRNAGYQLKRFLSVIWKLDKAVSGYPVCVTGNTGFNTASEVSASQMQADGDDLRVFVDGVEVDRWIGDMNTSTTKVWVNLDFYAAQTFTLVEDIGSGDDPTEIIVEESVLAMPYGGILKIGNEFFIYNGKNNTDQMFTGVKRAQKGSSAAAHTGGATIYWIQHDIWMVYGNPSASAPTIMDETAEPVFDLEDSDNLERFFYGSFGQSGTGESGGNDAVDKWIRVITEDRGGTNYLYGYPNEYEPPWEYIRAGFDGPTDSGPQVHTGYWKYRNPCGIDSMDLDGVTLVSMPSFDLGVWVQLFYVATLNDAGVVTDTYNADTTPSGNGNDLPWDLTEVTAGNSTELRFGVNHDHETSDNVIILNDLENAYFALESGNVPEATVGAEQENYNLEMTLTNNTTGQSISVALHMEPSEELEIDTDGKTVVYLKEGSSRIGLLVLDAGVRRDWLRLVPGENELEYTEEGVDTVTVTTQYNMRWYS